MSRSESTGCISETSLEEEEVCCRMTPPVEDGECTSEWKKLPSLEFDGMMDKVSEEKSENGESEVKEDTDMGEIDRMMHEWEKEKEYYLSRLEFYEKEAKKLSYISEVYANTIPSFYKSSILYKNMSEEFISYEDMNNILEDMRKHYRSMIRLTFLGNVIFTCYFSTLILTAFMYGNKQ